MIIAVDFDGTLHTGQWPSIGIPKPYAVDAMNRLKKDGHYLIIWTCRTGDNLTEAINWLLANNIPFDRVNDHNPEEIRLYGTNARKVHAHLYIDDKQLGGLPLWDEIYDIIKQVDDEYKALHHEKKQ
ncbi:hypothetical protein [Parabacteroides sp. PF5-9]|uniref:hypothetical protein n=1 Tax=Parabacteroides sp. PF5-9 TaxID=1742404 RepID=UPI0024738765|nr:hypothetical protein [Parabacteroides sp. PF5-9]MDH6357217.1 trehalose-6-phosphatase [Parabacteroides sp. PF5-9]